MENEKSVKLLGWGEKPQAEAAISRAIAAVSRS
jgi:hypothetical protein